MVFRSSWNWRGGCCLQLNCTAVRRPSSEAGAGTGRLVRVLSALWHCAQRDRHLSFTTSRSAPPREDSEGHICITYLSVYLSLQFHGAVNMILGTKWDASWDKEREENTFLPTTPCAVRIPSVIVPADMLFCCRFITVVQSGDLSVNKHSSILEFIIAQTSCLSWHQC